MLLAGRADAAAAQNFERNAPELFEFEYEFWRECKVN
jgi:hypothetical protein